MKMHFDCPGCFVRQAVRAGRLLGLSEGEMWELVRGAGQVLSKVNQEHPPPRNAVSLYDMISEKSGLEDPFRTLKKQSTRQALALYDELKKRIRSSDVPLETAIRLAACGNVIDYGVASSFDLMREIEQVSKTHFFRFDYEAFTERLAQADWVLFLGDNCGETVFDRLLIEELARPVKYAVRGGPIINDVTEQDAVEAGIHRAAQIVSTGCRAPGIVFEWCSEEFRRLFQAAPLIISKGQGNFETLSEADREIFFIFKVKCGVVAEFTGAPLHSMIFGRP